MPDRRLLGALSLSLLAHVLAVSSPAWHLPFESDEKDTVRLLEAHLVPPHQPLPKPELKPQLRRQLKPQLKPNSQARPEPTTPTLLAKTPSENSQAHAQEPPVAPATSGTSTAPVVTEPALTEPTSPQATPKPENTWPRQGHIRYIVTRGEKGFMLGLSVHSWEHDDARYSIRTVTETTGLVSWFKPLKIVQVSTGAIGPTGLAPQEFRVERDGKLAEGARFDGDAMRVSLTDGGATRREEPYVSGAQDLLSHIYQFGLMEKQQRFEVMITTGKKFASYAYDLVGRETISMPIGEVRTLHYRTPPMPGEQTTEIWLAPDYRNLPVRIRFIDRSGDIYDQNADEIEMDGKIVTLRGGS